MPLYLADYVLQSLKLNANDSLESLEERLYSPDVELGVVFSNDGRAEILDLARKDQRLSVAVRVWQARRPIPVWRYHALSSEGRIVGEIVEVPSGGPAIENSPPTDGEKVLIRAWNADINSVDPNTGRPPSGSIVALWHRDIATCKESTLRLFGALFNGAVAKEGAPYVNAWESSATLVLGETSALLKDSNLSGRLLMLALAEEEPRWRFLNYYRILEHAYLTAVFDALQNSFFQAPQSALQSADKTMKNEFNQLLHLIEKEELGAAFGELAQVIKSHRSTNRFCAAIEKAFAEDPKAKELRGDDQKGALLCYKIRCAIVHAGDGFLVYEKFDDADEVLVSITMPLVNAVMKHLQVEYSA